VGDFIIWELSGKSKPRKSHVSTSESPGGGKVMVNRRGVKRGVLWWKRGLGSLEKSQNLLKINDTGCISFHALLWPHRSCWACWRQLTLLPRGIGKPLPTWRE
jgi:hypothetical protein